MAGGTGLEEPGWPNLQSGPPAGALFMNAFAKASDINAKKQRLENQLLQMQQAMTLQNVKHDMDIQKMDFDQKYKLATLQRGYDQMGMQAYLADKRNEYNTTMFNIKGAQKDAIYSNAQELGDDLAAASQKYPIDSQAFQNEMNVIMTKHGGTLATPEGQRVFRTFSSQNAAASKESHKAADLMRRNFDASLSMAGQGSFNRTDFLQPDSAWATNDKGERYLPRIQEMGPDNRARWKTIGRQEELETLKAGGKVRYDTMPSKTYQQLRQMHDRMLEIGGNDLSQKPAVNTSMNEVTRTTSDGRPAVFDANTKQFIRWGDEQ